MADNEDDTRMLVNSGKDDDGEPNLRPWLSIKDDNPRERPTGDDCKEEL